MFTTNMCDRHLHAKNMLIKSTKSKELLNLFIYKSQKDNILYFFIVIIKPYCASNVSLILRLYYIEFSFLSSCNISVVSTNHGIYSRLFYIVLIFNILYCNIPCIIIVYKIKPEIVIVFSKNFLGKVASVNRQ
jgi:hypothetical protein